MLDGMRLILGDARLHVSEVDVFVHGTTLATNAIIERRGARTALIATDGFRDVLDIATESRYDQYDLFIDKPTPLVPRALRFTVPERIDVHGNVRLPLDEAAVQALAPALRAARVESVVFAFLHSYANPEHEQRAAAVLKAQMPALWVTLSCEVCPELREYERTSTAVANAYVQPLMDWLPGAHGGRTCGRAVPRRHLPRHLRRRPDLAGDGAALPGAADRVRAGRRRHLRRPYGHASRRGQSGLVRHGRHHRQDLPDRERRAAHRAHVRDRPHGALPQGQRPAGAHSGDRDGGDRRGRRLDRQGRRLEARHRRPRERRVGAGAGLLCARRQRCDGDRRRRRARPDRPRRLRGRHDQARARALAPGARAARRRAARPLAGNRGLRGARDGVREHGERRARACGGARRRDRCPHADRVRRGGAAARRARRREDRRDAGHRSAERRRRLGGRIPRRADRLRAPAQPPHAARCVRRRRGLDAARRDGGGSAGAGRARRPRRTVERAPAGLHALRRPGSRDHRDAAGARSRWRTTSRCCAQSSRRPTRRCSRGRFPARRSRS